MTVPQERVANVPLNPLARSSPWFFLNFALPSTVLSWISLLLTVAALAFLWFHPVLRAFYEVPAGSDSQFASAPLVGGVTAIVATILVWFTASRPGPTFPRVWVWFLCVAAWALVFLGLLDELDWYDKAVSACALGVLALLPRLLRLPPHSKWLFRVAPLTVALTIPVMLATGWSFVEIAKSERSGRVDRLIEALAAAGDELEAISQFDWSALPTSSSKVEELLVDLRSIQIPDGVDSYDIWTLAKQLGKDQDLANAASRVGGLVADALDPEVAPLTSKLTEPVAWWDDEANEWKTNPSFSEQTTQIEAYSAAYLSIFQEVSLPEGGRLQTLDHARVERESYEEQIRTSLGSNLSRFADRWLIFADSSSRQFLGDPDFDLQKIVSLPFEPEQFGDDLTLANVFQLFQLPYRRAEDLAHESPGCHPREYEKGGNELYRVDCYIYEPAPEGGARLLLEFRLVYAKRFLAAGDLPAEIYYIYPYDSKGDLDDAKREVMTALSAAGDDLPGVRMSTSTTSGSVSEGFRLRRSSDTIVFSRPTEEPDYPGNALRLRAFDPSREGN